jgi:hypothetical protein
MSYKPQVLAAADGGTGAASLTGILTGNGASATTASTVTQYGVLLGGSSNAISSTATGSAGQFLQSAGNSSNPVYSTATLPATATGTGKVLIADGTNWVASTPTFPNASATSGKVIKSDGTNWVASTETYAAPGTSGNVLTSNGTNWASSTPPYIATATGTLTNSQIKALHATPIAVLAAQGVGTAICVLALQIKMNYGGSNVFTAGASQTINLYYGTTTSIIIGLTNAQIVAAATQFTNIVPASISGANTLVDNLALNFYNPIATEITGNAANNNTITYRVVYSVVSI